MTANKIGGMRKEPDWPEIGQIQHKGHSFAPIEIWQNHPCLQ